MSLAVSVCCLAVTLLFGFLGYIVSPSAGRGGQGTVWVQKPVAKPSTHPIKTGYSFSADRSPKPLYPSRLGSTDESPKTLHPTKTGYSFSKDESPKTFHFIKTG